MIDASIASSDRLVVEQIHSFDTADAQIQLLLVARERDDRQTSIDCIIKRHNFKFSQRSTDGYSDFFWVANSEFPRSLTRAAANLARSESFVARDSLICYFGKSHESPESYWPWERWYKRFG